MKCWLRLLQWQYEDISSPSDAYVFELSWAEKFNRSVSVSSWNVQLQFSSFHEQRFNAQIGEAEFQHLLFGILKVEEAMSLTVSYYCICTSLCYCSVLTHLCGSVLHLIYRCFKALLLTRILNPTGPHCWGKKGDEGMNPKPINKLLSGAEFYITVT